MNDIVLLALAVYLCYIACSNVDHAVARRFVLARPVEARVVFHINPFLTFETTSKLLGS